MLSSVFGNCQTVLYSWIQGRIKYPFGILNWMPGWLWWHHPPLWWREDGGASHGMSDLNVSYSTCFRPQRKYWPYCKYIYIYIYPIPHVLEIDIYIYIYLLLLLQRRNMTWQDLHHGRHDHRWCLLRRLGMFDFGDVQQMFNRFQQIVLGIAWFAWSSLESL